MRLLRDIVLPVLLVLGVSWPWVRGGSASLQPGLLDFAEWLTLLPAVRSNLPLLLPALLVRSSLAVAVWVLMLYGEQMTDTRLRWFYRVVGVGFVAALLPPVDFFRGAFDDINYQQQFVIFIAAASGIIGAIGLRRWLQLRIHAAITGILAVVAILLAVGGLLWGYDILVRYEVMMVIGEGIGVYVLAQGMLAFANFVRQSATQTAA